MNAPRPIKDIDDVRDRVDAYARGVIGGTIIAGKLVRQAVQRHFDDQEFGPQRGLRFDEQAAWRNINFFRFLRHSLGEWGGHGKEPAQQFTPEPWQLFCQWNVYGWRKADGTRRFRTAYVEVARKNGKSTLLAANGIYMLLGDSEPGSRVYTAATKRDQARLVHSEAVRMVRKSPELLKRCKIVKDNILHNRTLSTFEPLGADANSTDGLNPHCCIVDELHAHPNGELWGVLDTAMGARRQPLLWAITTAGFDTESFCFGIRDYAVKVVNGVLDNDDWFSFVACPDDGDDWRDESCWAKANPNLGVSVKLDDLRRMAKQASENPVLRNEFLTKRLNIWTSSGISAIPKEHWNRCSDPFTEESLVGQSCVAGLDLSRTHDMTAYVMLFPPRDPGSVWKIMPKLFLPDKALDEMSGELYRHYKEWSDAGLVELTGSGEVHYGRVRQVIAECNERWPVTSIAFDPYNATETALLLEQAGFPVVKFGQNWANMNEPTKMLMEMAREGQLAHGGHPVLAVQAGDLEVKQDHNGNVRPIKPDRLKSHKRIDAMVALIMAIGVGRCAATETFEACLI